MILWIGQIVGEIFAQNYPITPTIPNDSFGQLKDKNFLQFQISLVKKIWKKTFD